MSSDKQNASSSWFKENIKKKECCYFQSDHREDICKCGYLKNEHTKEAIEGEDYQDEIWGGHLEQVPTDAFGEIRFAHLGHKTSKYVRVSNSTKPEELYRLLTEQWKLSPPKLLISVKGGDKNSYKTDRFKKMFHRGLSKVAKTMDTWIITRGTNEGVTKIVGQAVRGYNLSKSMQDGNIMAIGMATWGVIHNREALVHKDGRFPADYVTDTKGQGDLSCLDSNHTHFLLVDDGTLGHDGVADDARRRLEEYIADQHFRFSDSDSGITIPLVCVFLEGGLQMLDTMFYTMLKDIPCVVLKGSGGMADVIAHVSKLPISEVTPDIFGQLLKKYFGSEYDQITSHIPEYHNKIQTMICVMSHLLTIFTISEDNHGNLDVAILQALLEASKSDFSREFECWKKQLMLALIWNRADIAEKEILKEEREWESSDLRLALLLALGLNRPQFVSLLLENGVSLRDVLEDKKNLSDLYTHMPKCFFLRKLKERRGESFSLDHVSEQVRHLLGNFTKNIYKENIHPASTQFNMSIEGEPLCGGQAHEDNEKCQRDAGTDLFLWAVVHNNKEMAEVAWTECRDCITAALAASKILKKMAEEGSDADEAQEMLDLASHYEKHAIGVFSECHDNNEERAQKLLVRESPLWGRTTSLRLALEADDKDFVSQSGVQALLTQIWCGELSVDNPVWRVLMCMVFLPLICTGFIIFRGQQQKHPSCWSKLKNFYRSPQVKFYWNIVSYLVFLFLFAVVLMMDFQRTPSPAELLLYVWLLSLVCEEVRQLFHDPDDFGFREKFKMYIKDLWNILDVLSILLFALGLAFRLTSELFYTGKILLCIDYVVFCLRLMAIFTISQTLGPKIIIVGRMMKDTFLFMFLLSIWVVAYGVAKQGILIDNDKRLDWILRGAVYEPYLILFGNIPTNIDHTAFEIDKCSMNGTDPLMPKCPVLNEDQNPAFPEWLTIIMLCVYLLFANILLLNLLIAIFNFTVQEVHDNTDKIWKFQRYELIKEYHSRPAAPPPLIILSHLWLFIRKIVQQKSPDQYKEFKNELHQIEEEEVLSWEALMKDSYLLSAQQDQIQSMEGRILDTAQKVTIITKQLETEEETSLSEVLKKLAKLEEQTNQDLQWIMNNLKPEGAAAKETQP